MFDGLVEIDEENGVFIRDQYGREVVMWTPAELTEDGGLAAIAACNAIKLFYEQGVAEIARLIGKDVSHPDYISIRNNAGQEVRYPTADLL